MRFAGSCPTTITCHETTPHLTAVPSLVAAAWDCLPLTRIPKHNHKQRYITEDACPVLRGTTIVALLKIGKVIIAGDKQVSLGQTVIKGTARKVRRLAST